MEEHRVCIVGSGLTGVAAAMALTERGVPVVMLESGGTFPRALQIRFRDVDLVRAAAPKAPEATEGADFLNGAEGELRWIRTHALGGLSNYWSGITLRFAPKDFTEGERLHVMHRWPITYSDLEPFYAKVEKLIRIRGGRQDFEALPACDVVRERKIGPEWSKFAEACRARGRDLAVLPDAHGPSNAFSTLGTPYNAAVRLLGELSRRPGFRLIPHAHVTRVLMDPGPPLASGVEYVDRRSGVFHKLAAKAVVLAAGPLSSTRILLNSKSAAHPDGLGNSRGLLGRYLHDHPLAYQEVVGNFRFGHLDGHRNGGLYVSRERYESSAPLEATAILLYGGTLLRLSPHLLGRASHYWGICRSLEQQSGFSPLEASLTFVCCLGTQIPRQENHVALDESKTDALGVPVLQITAHYDEDELSNMMRGRALVPAILESAGYKVGYVESELQRWGTCVHYAGTARMHESSEWGVVDGWNRVHDTRNVLVVDASCFTTGAEKNPSLTAMAISMRAAAKLAAEGGS